MTGPDDPNTDAIAGLASELEGLRRIAEPLPQRIDELSALTAELADRIRSQAGRPGPRAMPSWLVAPADPAVTRAVLEELKVWITTVYSRYEDGAMSLPECWLWHPDIVEELLWLMHAWLAAYQGEGASVALVGDWHDRYRPGVARRIKSGVGTCSLEVHIPGRDEHRSRSWKRKPDAAEAIAQWWALARQERGPAPTPENLERPQ